MMAKSVEGGFECTFVAKPPKTFPQTECPVCLLILRQPYQVTCCGYSFCRSCIERTVVRKHPCPCCNAKKFKCFQNKGLQRSLYEFKVNCIHASKGCQWMGELGQLDKHLNIKAVEDEQLNGCQFAQIKCLYCSKHFQRSDIQVHQSDECPVRPFSCEHCKEFDSTYEDVTTNHLPKCDHYPVPCPNKCDIILQRQNVEDHIANNCPLAVIDCEFQHIGCKHRLFRKDMPAHEVDNMATHLSLQMAGQLQLTARINDLEKSLRTYTEEAIKKEQESVDKKIKDLKMGYCHRKFNSTEDNPLSTMLAFVIGVLIVLLLFGCYVELHEKKQLENSLHSQISMLLQVAQLQSSERQNPKLAQDISFLAELHNMLFSLNKDRLTLSEQRVTQARLQELQSHALSLPIEFTMTKFRQHKFRNDIWYSPPFYTDLKGYKLCLSVYANGNGEGYGTHISVYLHVMHGEFDDQLKWPLFGYGLAIELLSQNEWYPHLSSTTYVNHVAIAMGVGDRVVHKERSANGWGLSMFISHGDLQPYFVNRQDSLTFRISIK